MHRDIKPSNLAVSSLNPLRAIILDLGCATVATSSTDHMKGTVPYLAPEIMRLKQKRHTKDSCAKCQPYTSAADIWAMGLSMYQLFTRVSSLPRQMTIEEHEKLMVKVKHFDLTEVRRLLLGMLEWDNKLRISTVEATQHVAFTSTLKSQQSNKESLKRVRT
jgi:serine/threonine protein kinase